MKSKKPPRPKKKDWKRLDGKKWWEITICFPAKQSHASWFFDQFEDFQCLVCQGTGSGKKHRCRRPTAASMKPLVGWEVDE